jgi:hypothetical protein
MLAQPFMEALLTTIFAKMHAIYNNWAGFGQVEQRENSLGGFNLPRPEGDGFADPSLPSASACLRT